MDTEEVWGPVLTDYSLDREFTFTPENQEKLNEIKNFLTTDVPDKEHPWKELFELPHVGASSENVFVIGDFDDDECFLSQTQLQPTQDSQCSSSQHIISAELLESVLPLKQALEALQESLDIASYQLPPASMAAFINCSPELLEALCLALHIPELSYFALGLLCDDLLKAERALSFQWCIAFLQSCLLIQVHKLQARAPRMLLQTLTHFASKCQSATVEGLMVPCLFDQSFHQPQSELLVHLFTSCLSVERQTHFLRIALSKTFEWNESMIDLLNSIFETKYEISSEILDLLTTRFLDSTMTLNDSLKLCKLIKKVIRRVDGQITSKHFKDLNLILERNKTFLKKACLASLKKCSIK